MLSGRSREERARVCLPRFGLVLLVLLVLVHLAGCVHGPLAVGVGRVDSVTVAAEPVAGPGSAVTAVAFGQRQERPGAPGTCTDVDGPAVDRADPAEPKPDQQPQPQAWSPSQVQAQAVPGVMAGRGPPGAAPSDRAGCADGGRLRAELQVWRS
ncbi:hypothetical protein [Streptomyces sp. WAC06614]|uniref:hypothetical protein n=1 Tax=Streptomyces sp. WAC06614 TaxID=2487416 RepID=UPI000F765F54|nr:hypothetical protein [Streptomyces sp. WAC06614]RSS64840.1 hypothetical protein EF918_30160 [Streptomyces sp. WAC06614]